MKNGPGSNSSAGFMKGLLLVGLATGVVLCWLSRHHSHSIVPGGFDV
jgi:hypothetical protein